MNKVFVAIFFILVIACYNVQLVISYPDLKSYAAVLVGTSGALFTIMGIWIAFLYPNISASLKDSSVIPADFSVNGEETLRLKTVVVVIVISALVLIASLSLFVVSSFLDVKVEMIGALSLSRIITFFALVFSLCLFFGIYKVILVSVDLVAVVEHGERKRKADRNA